MKKIPKRREWRPKNQSPAPQARSTGPRLSKPPKSETQQLSSLAHLSSIKTRSIKVWAVVSTLAGASIGYLQMLPNVSISIVENTPEPPHPQPVLRIQNQGWFDIKATYADVIVRLNSDYPDKGCPPLLIQRVEKSFFVLANSAFDIPMHVGNMPNFPKSPVFFNLSYSIPALMLRRQVSIFLSPSVGADYKVSWWTSGPSSFGPECTAEDFANKAGGPTSR